MRLIYKAAANQHTPTARGLQRVVTAHPLVTFFEHEPTKHLWVFIKHMYVLLINILINIIKLGSEVKIKIVLFYLLNE